MPTFDDPLADGPGPPWERVTQRKIDGAEHQRRTPPQGRPPAGPHLGR